MRTGHHGYSLVEVLVAAAILFMAVAGATSMALALVTLQETNARVARLINYQEQAARLWQLGLDEASVKAVLPEDSAVDSLSISTESLTLDVIGLYLKATCTMAYRPNAATQSWAALTWVPGDSNAQRTNTIIAIRPILH